jgi:cell division protease FtsH
MAEFDEAIDRAVSGLEQKSRIISEQEKEIVSYHEMGHALVALQLPYADPVQKVTIVPRGVAALGMTLQLPLQDKYLFLKEELEDRIAVSLGGRASEEVRFGRVTTGAHNDLITATQLARRMVREFGMSEKLGLIAFADDRDAISARPSFGGSEKEYSEETARLIDEEIRAIIDSNHERAMKVLEDNKEILETLAKELMEKETISGAELKQKFESLKREATLSTATDC